VLNGRYEVVEYKYCLEDCIHVSFIMFAELVELVYLCNDGGRVVVP